MDESETAEGGGACMKYQNPVIRGFSPDPSICRVGQDYYLVTSTFEYFPGIPVYHSRDLVNWEQIGNCISWGNPVSLDSFPESGGIWAPTIRHTGGMFYVTAAVEKQGNFIVHTKDPSGVWSKPAWVDIGGIDPSLLFDDGKAYYCTTDRLGENRDAISMGVVDPLTGKTLESFRPVWYGTGCGFLEAPHVYHIGAWYYVLTAEGGTSFNHMVTIGRSESVWGPYESCPENPVLTNRTDVTNQVHCAGHGDLVEDGHGNWWMVHLAIRVARRTMSHLGRETFLTPFHWADGWPVFGNRKKARLEENGPLRRKQESTPGWRDDFSSTEWPCWWRFIRNPHISNYIRKNGALRMVPSPHNYSTCGSPCFVGVRQPDFAFELSVYLTFFPCRKEDEAGVLVYHTHEFFYSFGIRIKNGKKVIFMEKRADDFRQTLFETDWAEDGIGLVLTADQLKYTFYTEQKNGEREKRCTASTRFLSNEVVGRSFTGTMLGLYAKTDRENSAVAEFRRFSVVSPAVC